MVRLLLTHNIGKQRRLGRHKKGPRLHDDVVTRSRITGVENAIPERHLHTTFVWPYSPLARQPWRVTSRNGSACPKDRRAPRGGRHPRAVRHAEPIIPGRGINDLVTCAHSLIKQSRELCRSKGQGPRGHREIRTTAASIRQEALCDRSTRLYSASIPRLGPCQDCRTLWARPIQAW